MTDIPTQEELDAHPPRWSRRSFSYFALLRSIHIWWKSRQMGWPLTLHQALEVVQEYDQSEENLTPSPTKPVD